MDNRRRRGYFKAAPGLGNPRYEINSSVNLDYLANVRYDEPIENNSKLVFDVINLEWINQYSTPLISNRTDVNPDIDPADGNLLRYDEGEGYWDAGEGAQEGVLVIPDGRRTVDKENEYLVLTGEYKNWDQEYSEDFSLDTRLLCDTYC